MTQFILALVFCASLFGSAFAQGGMGPGPGTVHSAGVAFSITDGAGTFTGNSGSGSSTTLTSVTWGSGCNVVAVGFAWSSIVTTTISGATLDGSQTLTAVSGAFANNLSNSPAAEIFYIANPTGTSGTPTVTFNTALVGGVAAQIWCIKTTTTTPSAGAAGCAAASGNACPGNNTELNTTASLTVPSGGGLVGMCIGDLPASYTFTNMTKDQDISYQGQFGTNQAGSGHATGGTGASVTVTCADATADVVNWTLALAAWAP